MEEPSLPPGHAFFHVEKRAPALKIDSVIAVGNWDFTGVHSMFNQRIPRALAATRRAF